GQLLAELDRVNLQNALQSSQSNMRLAKDRLEYQHKEYLRIKGLHEKDLSSTQSLDEALYNYRTAVSNYATAKLDYEKARTNLGYAMIYSPIDGVVLSKEVEEGQTVAASMSTPTLFKIAQDLKQMQVVADIDEADIGEVRKGQRVSFTVDAYPDESFEGEVTQVRQEATTTNNVVTYEVVIKANNESLKLKPGLTANVTIYTLEKSNILVVANKALRFTPDSALIGSEDVVQRTAGIKEDETHKILWVRQGKVFKAIPVQVGITNGTLTEIISGISAGQKVILEATAGMMPGNDATSTSSSSKTTSSSTESSPFMPKRPGQNKTK
ncbi:MAG: efflux RND transporter periplasmic adaptor subunit, partial [Bacteroidaceae bacterium]|nr:efflux RND transporter periplasmic adaptor subunit [Bacteroidaceae bacterium]